MIVNGGGFIKLVAHKPLRIDVTYSFQYKPMDKRISIAEDHKFQIHFSSTDEAPFRFQPFYRLPVFTCLTRVIAFTN